MMVRSEILAKAWAMTLVLMALVVLIGIFAIPSEVEVTTQVHSDLEPATTASKWRALALLPALAGFFAWASTSRRRAEGNHDVWNRFAAVEFGVMGLLLITHSVIVLSASF